MRVLLLATALLATTFFAVPTHGTVPLDSQYCPTDGPGPSFGEELAGARHSFYLHLPCAQASWTVGTDGNPVPFSDCDPAPECTPGMFAIDARPAAADGSDYLIIEARSDIGGAVLLHLGFGYYSRPLDYALTVPGESGNFYTCNANTQPLECYGDLLTTVDTRPSVSTLFPGPDAWLRVSIIDGDLV